jgi:DNA-binding beta-propeller fold protein YncE
MGLQFLSSIDLPGHIAPGGFDHAALHRASRRLYVAHTTNDALDVIDCATDKYLRSIHGLTGVAGALVSDERNLIFTSNRGENTVGFFAPEDETNLVKIPAGIRPNGLSFDPRRNRLLAANVGDPIIAGSFTLSVIDIQSHTMIASIPVPGRTRWALFDSQDDVFYVNIADPAQIVVVDAQAPDHVARTMGVPAAGPHGLDLDGDTHRLFCACDAKKLITLNPRSGQALSELDLSGSPDVIFFNPALKHLYVAIGDPGVIDVFDTHTMRRTETIPTEKGTHTIGFDPDEDKIYAFLPQSHTAWVYRDEL